MSDWERFDIWVRLMALHQQNTANALSNGLITLDVYKDYLINEQNAINRMMKVLKPVGKD